jgi:hypothetical protein
VLRQLHSKVSNLRAGTSNGATYPWLVSYIGWAGEAVRMLHGQISSRDIDRLVLTRRYEVLLSMIGKFPPDTSDPAVNGLLSTELDERTAACDEACLELGRLIERWSRPGVFVVLDTSVYITHSDKLEEMDFAAMADVRGEDIHVLVPILVVEELDGLKQRGDNHGRWRASYTLAVLDRVLAHVPASGLLRAADLSALEHQGIPRGEVSMELLLDPPQHIRLPNNDDEIIDRTLAAQSLAGSPVTLLTYDTSQSFKARAAGLPVRRLAMPTEVDPEPGPKRSGGTPRKDRVAAPDGTGDSGPS